MSRELVCMVVWANMQLAAQGASATLAFDAEGDLKAWVKNHSGVVRPWSATDGCTELVQSAIRQTLQHQWYEPGYLTGSFNSVLPSERREGLLA